jgi:hypothetical protein
VIGKLHKVLFRFIECNPLLFGSLRRVLWRLGLCKSVLQPAYVETLGRSVPGYVGLQDAAWNVPLTFFFRPPPPTRPVMTDPPVKLATAAAGRACDGGGRDGPSSRRRRRRQSELATERKEK